MTIRVFEAFAGVGSQRMALRNLGVDHEVVAIAEIDKFAIKSYEAIHGETNNLGDISQLGMEDIPDHDLFTYSFPCQDISVAGKGLGLDEGSDTRSGLLWECQKVIAGKKPKYLLLENVKNLVGKKHKHNFDKWLEWLEEQGYTNYWQVLNAKNYGIPQNRERVFVVSILGEHEPYEFPEPVELELRLKDVLESEVGEKYYLDDDRVRQLTINWEKVNKNGDLQVVANTSATGYNKSNVYYENGISPTIAARDYKGPNQVLQVGQYDTNTRTNSNRFRTYSPSGIGASLTTMGGGGLEPHVMLNDAKGIPIKNATKKGYINAYDGDGVDLAYPTSKTRRGRVQKGLSQTLDTGDSKGVVVAKEEYGRMGRQAVETLNENNVKHSDTINPFNKRVSSKDGVSPTLTTRPEGFKTAILPVSHDLRIRKLTPKECWRLMGFSDDDFRKAEKVNSNSQLYKQAGNSIVVDVLEGIFKQLLEVAE